MKSHGNSFTRRLRTQSRRAHNHCLPELLGEARVWAVFVLLAAGPLLGSDTTDAIRAARTAAKSATIASNVPGLDVGGGTNSLDDKHALAIGDQVSFRIVEDEEDPKSLTVTDSGEFEVPYIGRFQAVGKTCRQLAGELKAELEKDYYYQATVIVAVNVMAKSRGRVYLVGPVHVPGPQEIPSDEVLTLSKAILRAGGFTDFADKKSVKVTRQSKTGGKEETFTINVGKVLEKGTTERDLALEPGDLIFVPEKLVRF